MCGRPVVAQLARRLPSGCWWFLEGRNNHHIQGFYMESTKLMWTWNLSFFSWADAPPCTFFQMTLSQHLSNATPVTVFLSYHLLSQLKSYLTGSHAFSKRTLPLFPQVTTEVFPSEKIFRTPPVALMSSRKPSLTVEIVLLVSSIYTIVDADMFRG